MYRIPFASHLHGLRMKQGIKMHLSIAVVPSSITHSHCISFISQSLVILLLSQLLLVSMSGLLTVVVICIQLIHIKFQKAILSLMIFLSQDSRLQPSLPEPYLFIGHDNFSFDAI